MNDRADERCRQCDESVRPPDDEPIRPLDPLDILGKGNAEVGDATGRADDG